MYMHLISYLCHLISYISNNSIFLFDVVMYLMCFITHCVNRVNITRRLELGNRAKDSAQFSEILGVAGEAVADLKQLFSLAEKFGYAEWIEFDASIVRGLAYYTGVVFETDQVDV
ncbi:hypothetical protein SO802_006812 [Lithocarpus litseifolius]|uniref:histidine--tRNA ligase n=1 Tax=Lithocarpus litseifolius TaxID=425828 RepID=A0AAW2DNL8_9ROSI